MKGLAVGPRGEGTMIGVSCGRIAASVVIVSTFFVVEVAIAHAELSKPTLNISPGIPWISKSGLDAENNKIDGLIATFGSTCNRHIFKPGQCRIEKELRLFLGSLLPERAVIGRELEALGAICSNNWQDLHCAYEKHVTVKGMKGSVTISESDDFFKIDFYVTGQDGALSYSATVELKSTQIKKPTY
jgi:hypothetical protein